MLVDLMIYLPHPQCLNNAVVSPGTRSLLKPFSRELCGMKDRLLQEELAMARLNPSGDEVLEGFLDSIIDD